MNKTVDPSVNHTLFIIGIMTGNSLDGIDSVLTAFHPDGSIEDLCSHFSPFDNTLYSALRALQATVANANGVMATVETDFEWQSSDDKPFTLDKLQTGYITQVAKSVEALLTKAAVHKDRIDLIGLHGQTIDHSPPSRRQAPHSNQQPYTVQLGNGQQLADLTGITVVYDFRSDDLMHGGEGAPFAPMHNLHLVEALQRRTAAHQAASYPVTFCNAGNTGNLTHITHDKGDAGRPKTYGWDTGPFNHFPDQLVRANHPTLTCDHAGQIGQTGNIHLDLLAQLFHESVRLPNGDNYLLKPPPKSADPNHYNTPSLLNNPQIAFEDRLRTAEYFSAYLFVHSLGLTEEPLQLPTHFLLFGGGWHNPVCLEHFKGLLEHDLKSCPLLPEHLAHFQALRERLKQSDAAISVRWSDELGINSRVMEARIFADMARCRVIGKPYSTPDITGVRQPVVAGLIRFPQGSEQQATPTVRALLQQHQSAALTHDLPDQFDARWSRAAAGWSHR